MVQDGVELAFWQGQFHLGRGCPVQHTANVLANVLCVLCVVGYALVVFRHKSGMLSASMHA